MVSKRNRKRKEEIFIDLKEEKVIFGNNELKFKVDSFKKKGLLEGLDDIALSLKKSDKIEIFKRFTFLSEIVNPIAVEVCKISPETPS